MMSGAIEPGHMSMHVQLEQSTHHASSAPALSIVILTWNEADQIEACLHSLARQTSHDFEVIVVDAASTDSTVRIVERIAYAFPVPLRLHVAPTRLRVGPARNLGVELARADLIAFVSADAEADERWVEESLQTKHLGDVMFGRQIHAPARPNIGAAVRGLRYHFPETDTEEPERYASNVNAVVRRDVLTAFPFGSSVGASAVDDLLLARRSDEAGYRVAYNPQMVVFHHDVDSVHGEFVKNLREGVGWGEHTAELGLHRPMLAWGALLILATAALAIFPSALAAFILVLVVWAPALRRGWRRRNEIAPLDLAVGIMASPAFDLAFLVAYVRGLLSRRRPRPVPIKTQDISS